MLQLVTSFIFLASAAARPGLLRTQTSIHPIGAVIGSIPTSITHQSQTQIHSPILAPAITSVVIPAVVTQSRPILASQVRILQDQRQGEHVAQNQQSMQDKIDREQRLRSAHNKNIQIMQKQMMSGQTQSMGAHILGGQTSVRGNQEKLLKNARATTAKNQRTNSVLVGQQINDSLSNNARALIVRTRLINDAVKIGGIRLENLKKKCD